MPENDPSNTNILSIEEAVELHYRRIYHFALHLTRNAEDAGDLTQYAYQMLIEKRQSIQDPSKVKSWLHSTVYRKFIDGKRKQQRHPSVELKPENEPATTARPGLGIDAEAARSALLELDETLRAPLSLFYLEGYSYKEIASTLGLPIGTVMSRLHRGKRELHDRLTTRIPSLLPRGLQAKGQA